MNKFEINRKFITSFNIQQSNYISMIFCYEILPYNFARYLKTVQTFHTIIHPAPEYTTTKRASYNTTYIRQCVYLTTQCIFYCPRSRTKYLNDKSQSVFPRYIQSRRAIYREIISQRILFLARGLTHRLTTYRAVSLARHSTSILFSPVSVYLTIYTLCTPCEERRHRLCQDVRQQ